ncbi:hypothetical protein [Celeribacter sp. ULVN23_4]
MTLTLALYTALFAFGALMVLWAAWRLVRKANKTPLHVQVHQQVYEILRQDPNADLPERAGVCFQAYTLYLYLVNDGIDAGIGNMEPDKLRELLPALKPLGLSEAAREIEAFIEVYEEIERLDAVDEALGEEYQATARELDRRLYPVLREIPERLEQYLA